MKKSKDGYLICQVCGKSDETVKHIKCGYSDEIDNEIVWEIICEDCEQEHLNDI